MSPPRSPIDVEPAATPPVAADDAKPRRPVPIEDAPLLVTGRMHWGPAHRVALETEDYRRLLVALDERSVLPFAEITGDSAGEPTRFGLRLDLTDGLTANAVELARLESAAGVFSTKALSLVAAGDMCVFSAGEPRIDPRVSVLLGKLEVGDAPRFAILNELADLFLASLSCPWSGYEKLAERLVDLGVHVSQFATPTGGNVAEDLNLLLLHSKRHPVASRIIDEYALPAAELLFPRTQPTRITSDLDFLEALTLDRIDERVVRCRRLGGTLRLRHALRAGRGLTWLVRSAANGWHCDAGDGRSSRHFGTSELIEWISRVDDAGGVGVVCEPRHFKSRDPRRRGAAAVPSAVLRSLPYPFHHYLAVNSDVDWSTPAQVESVRERLTGELGLPVAGSFYLCAGSDHAIAATGPSGERPLDGTDAANVPRWFHLGALDTLHAWVDTIDTVTLLQDGRQWRWPDSAPACERGGILVSADSGLHDARLVARGPGGLVVTCGAAVAPPGADPRGVWHAFFAFARDADGHVAFGGPGWSISLEADASGGHVGATVHAVVATDLDPAAVERGVDSLIEDHVAPLLFTTHGGGRHVRDYANLRTPAVADRDPEQGQHDLDQPASPYHLLPALRRLGVRFVSPIGGASTPRLARIDELVQPLRLADGTETWTVRRLLSRRHETLGLPERWDHDKNASHPAALGFQLRDVIQRLHWLEPGSGGILYTHLGHNVGSQRCDRRAWTEETERAFELLAAYYHGEGGDDAGGGDAGGSDDAGSNDAGDDGLRDESAFRLWVASSASILLYAVVAARAAEHVVVTGSTVRINQWRDERLGVDVPASARFGTKLLHGLTAYVDAAAGARVFVADEETDCFVRNAPDETGRASVTVVDDSAVRCVFVGDNRVATRSVGGVVTVEGIAATVVPDAAHCTVEWDLFPVPLAGATHWSFELDAGADTNWSLAFRDGSGLWYEASTDHRRHRSWRIDPRTHGHRHVFSLTARVDQRDRFPRGDIVGLRLCLDERNPAANESIRLRRVFLLRPHPALVGRKTPRLLAGRVRCDVPIPFESMHVVATTPGGVRREAVRPDGSYVLRDLPPDLVLPCHLEVGEHAIPSIRGFAAVTSGDEWAWDYHVRPADVIS